MKWTFRTGLAISLGLLLAAGSQTQAATLTWNNAIPSGSWTNGVNWGGAMPGPGDTANWTFASGSTVTLNITVPGSNSVGAMTMDFAGSTYATIGNTTPTVSLTGSGTEPGLFVGSIQIARADAANGYTYTLADTIVFNNMSLSVGSAATRGFIQLGEKVGANNTVVAGVLQAGANSSFSAYLTSLQVGYNTGNNGVGFGTLDLSAADNAMLDISGNAEIGANSSGPNMYRSGTLSLGNGGTGTASNLYLGYMTAAENTSSPYRNGYLNLSNSTFQVGAGGCAYLGGRSGNQSYQYNIARINITVNGRAGGLDIQNSAASGLTLKYPTLTSNDGGNGRIYNQITVILGDTTAAEGGWCWGLRWSGDHVSNNTPAFTAGGAMGLLALLDSTNQYARLRVITNALSSIRLAQHLVYLQTLNPSKYGGKTVADLTPADFIVYDGGYTYIGAHFPPLPVVSNVSAVVDGSAVTLNGHLVDTGQDVNVSATVFWGTNDAGANMSGWTHTNRFPGLAVVGPLSTNVTPVGSSTRYYYNFFASNSSGYGWASPAGSFSTTGAPSVNNAGGAIRAGANSAILQGEVTGGNPEPSAWIYWGEVNQNKNKDLWAHTNAIGMVSNWTFSATVGGLTPGATYYYSCYASNSYGEAWAPVTNFAVARTWSGAGADALASNPANWLDGVAPQAGDGVFLDATTNKNMTWDLNIPLASWAQIGYLGTVTVATVYGTTGFTNLNITGNCMISNGVWTHVGPQTTEACRLSVTIGGSLIIGPNGLMDVAGKGYPTGYGPGYSSDTWSSGNYGGRGNWSGGCYGSIVAPTNLGSGGYYNCWGGGAILLRVTGMFRNDGIISANGKIASEYGKSGSGGSIYITSGMLTGSGIMRANSAPASYGGGGRVALVVTQAGADFTNFTGTISAYGGDRSDSYAGAGTIYMQCGADRPDCGTVLVNNNAHPNGGTLGTFLPSGPPNVPGETDRATFCVTNAAYLYLTNNITVGDIYVQSSNAWLDLGFKTLTVRSREHKIGPGTATNVLNRGTIIWWPDIPKGVIYSTW